MDVLKPETYWVGDRCYRKNPSRNGHRGVTLDRQSYEDDSRDSRSGRPAPYVEVDDEEQTLCML